MASDTPRITEQGVATLSEQAWERARRRAEIIGPLAQSPEDAALMLDVMAGPTAEDPKTAEAISGISATRIPMEVHPLAKPETSEAR